MAALFAFAVIVQVNDPDPLRWILIYGAAAIVSGIVAVRGSVAFWLPAALAAIALAWSLYWAAAGGEGPSVYTHMFDAWEMKNVQVEEAREASGLFIVTAWSAVLAVRSWRASRRP
jgi:ABC-type uncharacterized transport system permease subunit